MTQAEKEKLAQKGLVGVRLSCQIACDARHDRAGDQPPGGQRPGRCRRRRPRQTIEPPPVWTTKV